MASRLEQKERARAARVAAEQADRRAATRRRSLTRLGAVVVAAIVVVAVAVVVSHKGSSTSSQASAPRATQSREVASLFGGIPQSGTVLGSPKAPHTLIEFADLQCPVCQRYTLDVLPSVVQRYVRTGKLRLQLKLRTFIGPDSIPAAQLAYAAAAQNKIWPFADLFYLNQGQENSGYVTSSFLKGIADSTPGLNASKALAGTNSPQVQQSLHQDDSLANALQSQQTPDFFLRRGSGGPLTHVVPSDLTPQAFSAALSKALTGQ
jgi:protein-disulfide isomerase